MDNQDYGDLPIQDFTHKLMMNIIIIKWVCYLILASMWVKELL
jgi:hypothetical protein